MESPSAFQEILDELFPWGAAAHTGGLDGIDIKTPDLAVKNIGGNPSLIFWPWGGPEVMFAFGVASWSKFRRGQVQLIRVVTTGGQVWLFSDHYPESFRKDPAWLAQRESNRELALHG